MIQDHLDDEMKIADERANAADRDTLALQQPICEVLSLAPLISVPPTTTVAESVRVMVAHGLGCLLITENDQLLGLFTERDVMRKAMASEVPSDAWPVADLMTSSPDTLSADSPLVFALHRMTVGGYRHVPLLDANGKPVAVVSMRDIVEYLVELYPNQVLNLPPHPEHNQWKGREGG